MFTAGYLIRAPAHLGEVFDGEGEIGREFYRMVADQMGLRVLTVAYLAPGSSTCGPTRRFPRRPTSPA